MDFKGYAAGTVPEKIRDFVSANMAWMVKQVKENPTDSHSTAPYTGIQASQLSHGVLANS